MDDLASVLEGSHDEGSRRDAADSDSGSPQKSSRSGGFGFASLREKASIQDRLIEK